MCIVWRINFRKKRTAGDRVSRRRMRGLILGKALTDFFGCARLGVFLRSNANSGRASLSLLSVFNYLLAGGAVRVPLWYGFSATALTGKSLHASILLHVHKHRRHLKILKRANRVSQCGRRIVR